MLLFREEEFKFAELYLDKIRRGTLTELKGSEEIRVAKEVRLYALLLSVSLATCRTTDCNLLSSY